MSASIYLKSADGSGNIRSGEIDGHDTLVAELEELYESGPELGNLDINPLVREKMESIIEENDIDENDVEPLLGSFIDSLHEWQQSSEKVVLLLVYNRYIILAHGHNEDGSYYNGDEYEVGERILDTDNIISSSKITESNGSYELEYHTRSDSDHFRRFIGLSQPTTDEKRVYVTFNYQGNGISTNFSMSESDFIENDNIYIDTDECELIIYGDNHPLEKVSWDGGSYDGSLSHRLEKFHSDLERKDQNFHIHDEKIKNINGLVDQADSDIEVVENQSEILIDDATYQKESTPGDTLVVYATNKYDRLDQEFLDEIVSRLINGSVLDIYGPVAEYSTNPLTISLDGNSARVEFKSIDESEINSARIEVIEELYRNVVHNIRDKTMSRMLARVFFELVHILSDSETEHLRIICDSFVLLGNRITQHETDIIEYKRELPSNSVDDIVDEMINESPSEDLGVLIWGISEDKKYQVSPLQSTPGSDDYDEIEEKCRQRGDISQVYIHEVHVDSDDTSGKILLGLMLEDASQQNPVGQFFS